jgi:hypothetical protein
LSLSGSPESDRNSSGWHSEYQLVRMQLLRCLASRWIDPPGNGGGGGGGRGPAVAGCPAITETDDLTQEDMSLSSDKRLRT